MVRVVRGASPDLKLRPVGGFTISDVQAFVTKHFDGSTRKRPLLGCSACAALDGDKSSVGVGSSSHAFR